MSYCQVPQETLRGPLLRPVRAVFMVWKGPIKGVCAVNVGDFCIVFYSEIHCTVESKAILIIYVCTYVFELST